MMFHQLAVLGLCVLGAVSGVGIGRGALIVVVNLLVVPLVGGALLRLAMKLFRYGPITFGRCWKAYLAAYIAAGIVAAVLLLLLPSALPAFAVVLVIAALVHVWVAGGILRIQFAQALLADGAAIVAMTVLAIPILYPALGQAGIETRKVNDRANLHQIGLSIVIYQVEHDRFPASFDELYPKYLRERELFVSPNDLQPATTAGGMPYSYEHIGQDEELRGRAPRLAPNVIVAYTRKGIFPGGRNCLFVDTHVEWLTEAEIAASFAELTLQAGLSTEDARKLRAFYQIDD